MNKTLTFLIGFFILMTSYSQESECYKKIDFESFVKNKTSNSYNYIRNIYKKLYYESTIENEEDKSYKVLMICNGNEKIELIGIDSDDEFVNEIKRVITLVNNEFLIDDQEKYMTEIPIKVDFEPQEDFKWKTDLSKIHLFSFSHIKKIVPKKPIIRIQGIECEFPKHEK
ncbi:hypothetical protein [Aquimarina algiphila]|uniref:Uncharacterized protein n=1 Tax=Aquimarina algiphila TaxID=2047982 RepID=A0A554VNE2_9FLAO|nr:hypothetical protein [Aquimarina algiphila]TSE09879.1 hypothetical protein FOF46_07640 [Aquimarina algiphila]